MRRESTSKMRGFNNRRRILYSLRLKQQIPPGNKANASDITKTHPTNQMCHGVTHCSARAHLIVGGHCEGVLEASSESGDIKCHLGEVRQVPIWHIQLGGFLSSSGCYDHPGEVQTPSVCVVPADCDHTTRRSRGTLADRSRDCSREIGTS